MFNLTSKQINANFKKIQAIKLFIKTIKTVSVSKALVRFMGGMRIGTDFLESVMNRVPKNVYNLGLIDPGYKNLSKGINQK